MSTAVGLGVAVGAQWRDLQPSVAATAPVPSPALPALPGVSAAVAQDFAALYTAEFGRLAGYLTALTGDVDVAREAAQEAFTRLFARWRSVREPRAFAYVVGTNLCRHHWKQSTRERAAVETLGAALPAGRPAHDPWLQDLVQRLPLRLREVVLLHYYADLPISSVAAAIHRPVGTVKRRLHEARAALAAAVSESEEGVPA
ncbi:MAG: polymerase sigma-70 factor, subfamily [Actinomycetota bacterium]|jgi:RNA polymerase sigma-70 factor (ECF subfamily)|nr:polymerase sigma-70 factor, subfamily [Actinomycetota bacterium]